MQARRPRRLTVATSIFLAVLVALVVIVVRGPAKFFAARDVQTDASCVVRHCPPAPDDKPDGHVAQKFEDAGH
jgi:hypothetical protein